jgi:hypothetical protein
VSTDGAGRRRTVGLALLVCVATLLPTGPAAADPAGPTHFRSTITAVVAADGEPIPIEVEVLGGDAFLVVRAQPGTLVEVPGYEGEPYVRIAAEGTVEVNERSPARWLNDARYGAAEVAVPPSADEDAPPSWVLVARDGVYAWHDHRIHFMSPVLPPQVDTESGSVQPVLDWSVPLLVDGRQVEVSGQLAWVPGPTPVVPWGLTVLVAGLVVGLVVRRPGWLTPVVLTGAAVTGLAGLAATVGLPPGADGEPSLVVLPVMAVALVVGGRWLATSGRRSGLLLTAAAGLPLLVWGVVQVGALTRPIVPGWLPVGAVRAATMLAFAAGSAGLVAGTRAGLALTSLDAIGEPDDGTAQGTAPSA